jgi:hypothetical protein
MVVGIRKLTFHPKSIRIAFNPESIILPPTFSSQKARHIPYSAVLSLDIVGKGILQQLFIGTAKKNYLFKLETFNHTREEILARFEEAFVATPEGEMAWLRLNKVNDTGEGLKSKSPTATLLLCALLVMAFILSRVLILKTSSIGAATLQHCWPMDNGTVCLSPISYTVGCCIFILILLLCFSMGI